MYVFRLDVSHSAKLGSDGHISAKVAKEAMELLFKSINLQAHLVQSALNGGSPHTGVTGRMRGRTVYVVLDVDIEFLTINKALASLFELDKKAVIDEVKVMHPYFLTVAMEMTHVDKSDLDAVLECAIADWEKFNKSEDRRSYTSMKSDGKSTITLDVMMI